MDLLHAIAFKFFHALDSVASLSAYSIASIRLTALAKPLPAISKAVP
jgi:hypothetical protein